MKDDDPIEAEMMEWRNRVADLMTENGKLRAALNQMFDLASGTRIREVQAMAEANWSKHHRDAAQEDWNEINEIHRKFHQV